MHRWIVYNTSILVAFRICDHFSAPLSTHHDNAVFVIVTKVCIHRRCRHGDHDNTGDEPRMKLTHRGIVGWSSQTYNKMTTMTMTQPCYQLPFSSPAQPD
jgi:hypothetical protein